VRGGAELPETPVTPERGDESTAVHTGVEVPFGGAAKAIPLPPQLEAPLRGVWTAAVVQPEDGAAVVVILPAAVTLPAVVATLHP